MKLFQKLIKVLSKFKSTPTEYHLHGKQIDLTSDNIAINSTNFSVNSNGVITATGANITGQFSNYDTNGNLAVRISGNNLKLYDFTNIGDLVGSLSSIAFPSSQNVPPGIVLAGLANKTIMIGFRDSTSTTEIKTLIRYSNIDDNSLPIIRNTSTGVLFSGLSGGGIQVQSGLIKSWNMTGAWSGTYYVTSGGTTYAVTVSQGLMTGINAV